jgi:hypothetical protein
MDELTMVSISPTLEKPKQASPKFLVAKQKIVAYQPQVVSNAKSQCKGAAK